MDVDYSHIIGRAAIEKINDLMPRQMFAIAIQATIGSKIMACETVLVMRKIF